MVISLVVTGYLLFFSIILKQSKMLYFLDFSWMWIQLAYCTDYNRVDYPNYAHKFDVIFQEDIQSTEYGYALINKLFYKLGVNFNIAYATMMLFVIIALAIWIYNKCEYYSEAAALLLIYPFYISGIQIRSFIASVIILYGLDFLLKGDKKSLLLFIAFCIMATLIQSSSIIYILLLPIRLISRKKTIIYTLALTFTSFFIIKYFYNIFSTLFGAKRFEEKVMIKNTLLEVGMIGIWQLTLLIIFLFLFKALKTENNCCEVSNADETIINILIFLSFLIPMYIMDFSLERILRSLLPLYYCFFLNMSSKIYSQKRIYIKGMFYGWFIITTLIFNVYVSNRWDIVIKPFINNNDLINNPLNHIHLFFLIISLSIYLFFVDYKNIQILKLNTIEE